MGIELKKEDLQSCNFYVYFSADHDGGLISSVANFVRTE